MKNNLYVLRHCKTIFNTKNIISGQTNCPLIDFFVNDSILKNESPLNSYILITSPLSRCVCTGKILQSQSGLLFSTFVDNRLIERNMGILEGKKRCDLIKEYPVYFCDGRFKDYMTPPRGESYSDFKSRVVSFASTMEKLLFKNNVIICSHNQTLRMLTAIINHKDYTDIPKYPNGVVMKILGADSV